MLIRFVAVGLIGFSLAEISLGFVVHAPFTWWAGLLKGLPGLAGLGILVKSRTLATWLNDWLDF